MTDTLVKIIPPGVRGRVRLKRARPHIGELSADSYTARQITAANTEAAAEAEHMTRLHRRYLNSGWQQQMFEKWLKRRRRHMRKHREGIRKKALRAMTR
jgi:hypothetical protein